MDRINGAGTTDIGGGRRGFRDENLGAGVEGTEVTALWANMLQEEILKVCAMAGLSPSEADWTQLYQAIGVLDDALFADVVAAFPYATTAEAIAGVLLNKIINPKTLADVLTARIATQIETDGGTVNNKFIVPSVMRNIFRFFDASFTPSTSVPSNVMTCPAIGAAIEQNLIDTTTFSTAKLTIGARDAGVWLVMASIQYTGAAQNKSLRIHKNGAASSYTPLSRIGVMQNGVGADNDTYIVTAMVRLASGDQISADLLHTISGTQTVTQGRFTATRIAL
ncbi:hypothetical protein B5K08_15775 [Rhizobium leguminosarum bv. trifolii]|uniref:Uncharacterized protein n=1 Tax=Rhizobium leguminosarum bv. trifolii TaxID=386 RepID=A0A3E1BH74_RHILT|nr:hypothetical protein [Rhizobium leguminosarum]RFB91757.1 hypothetical protein B5K08_15775 [Rhizobium leguminosarum bv. trifolii]RFB92274.1 hypothetical protein B5K10_15770 [Rhizobium leguminosarum bv. trifolii]